jgi:hypothetical protein
MYAPNSKTYIGWTEDNEHKKSHKGISKTTNNMTPPQYGGVLETKIPVDGKNYGFRLHDGHLVQYEQTRQGLTYLYLKRAVQPGGVRTKPLDIWYVVT